MKAFSLLTLAMVRIYVRDRLTMMMSLALMVFMMTLFGLAMGDEQFQVVLPVAVWDQAADAESARLLATLRRDDLLAVVEVADDAAMQEQIRRASAIAGLVLRAPGATLVTSDHLTKWQRIGIERLQGVVRAGHGGPPAPVWAVEARPIAVVKNRYIDFIFPGMLAMAIMQTCLSSGVVVLQAKKMGVLRRLRLTPISSAQLFSGFISARLLVVVLHLVALGLVAVLGFGAQILAPWVELLAGVCVGCITFISLGLMLAVLAPSFESGNLMVQLFSLPMTFLCGIFFKVSAMPEYLHWLPKVLPLTYLADMMRGMISLGTPLSSFRTELAVLAGWLAVAMVIAAFGVRHLQREEG